MDKEGNSGKKKPERKIGSSQEGMRDREKEGKACMITRY